MSTRSSKKTSIEEAKSLVDESPDAKVQFPRLSTLTPVDEIDVPTAQNVTRVAGMRPTVDGGRRGRYEGSVEPLHNMESYEEEQGIELEEDQELEQEALKTPFKLPFDELFGPGTSPSTSDVVDATTDTIHLNTCAPIVYHQYKKALVSIDDLVDRLLADKPDIIKPITAAIKINSAAEGQLQLQIAVKKLSKHMPDFIACAVVVHTLCEKKHDKKAQALQIIRGWLTIPLVNQDQMLLAIQDDPTQGRETLVGLATGMPEPAQLKELEASVALDPSVTAQEGRDPETCEMLAMAWYKLWKVLIMCITAPLPGVDPKQQIRTKLDELFVKKTLPGMPRATKAGQTEEIHEQFNQFWKLLRAECAAANVIDEMPSNHQRKSLLFNALCSSEEIFNKCRDTILKRRTRSAGRKLIQDPPERHQTSRNEWPDKGRR